MVYSIIREMTGLGAPLLPLNMCVGLLRTVFATHDVGYLTRLSRMISSKCREVIGSGS